MIGSDTVCPRPNLADIVNRRAKHRKEKIENKFNSYKTNMIKESVRMGYNDISDFYYAHVQLDDAFKNYVRTCDYCTTSKHIIQMCLNVILLDPMMNSKLRCAAGLAYLETKKYKLAARKFLETGIELANNYTDVIAPQDAAIYGGLCALACFDRTKMKNTNRPTSSHPRRSSSSQSNRKAIIKYEPKVSPLDNANPRELSWKKKQSIGRKLTLTWSTIGLKDLKPTKKGF
ncbi:hypothetical protein ZIOFF_013321 [Zingiber officinale]|uniref:26S proteasome regulatory subunit Rpn7 N-terminal domain-containing protein n=1 Tax=Zingiber officinale TaxID=94328 RepID=A0A8J5HBH8_ZINOF|nr:hypothetical protein ZIOFF_013321 [Zingiber officinale]